MSNIINISTLEFYNYGENNMMTPTYGSYKVKISDKDGNIITIEKDGALYACVGLQFDSNTGVLTLVDVAHDNAELANVEMPNADYIYNCRYDEASNSILFDVKSLYGDETSTIELNVDSIVELYEAGQGIQIGEKGENGRKPISIKLSEGEDILQLSDDGLSISDKIATDDEVAAAISGKADISYVDEKISEISGITGDVSSLEEKVDKIFDILGTEDDDPNIDERIDSKADLDEFNDLEDEVGEIEASLNTLSGTVEDIGEKVDEHEEKIEDILSKLSGATDSIDELTDSVEELSGEVENNKVSIEKITSGLPESIKEAYILVNKLGEQLGEQINIYKNSSIREIDYVHYDDQGHEGQFLKIVYVNDSGETDTVYIDISEIIVESEFGDGLQSNDGVVSIKIDETSDQYLSVSENGLKLAGLSELITALMDVDNQQWSAINQNRADLEAVDAQLWEAISNEAQERANADILLQHNLNLEAENRQNADSELEGKILEEKNERIANDNIISGAIDSKVAEERERAILAETNLSNNITAETAARQSEDARLENLISQEATDRETADNSIKNELLAKISAVSGEVAANASAISQEVSDRMEADNELSDEISEIRSTYATKEYVDAKDAEVYEDAVTSAITVSTSYTENEIDSLELELKQYCDDGHTQLQREISDNTTKISAISNLRGVSGTDISNYDDDGNGILDVLHKEFHQYKGETIHNAKGAQIKNEDEVAVGRYNISHKEIDETGVYVPSGCTIFSVGIGTSDEDRKNAIEIMQDGTVYLWIEGEFMNINELLGMLAHEIY